MKRELITVQIDNNTTMPRVDFIRMRTLEGATVSAINKELIELGCATTFQTIYQLASRTALENNVELATAKREKKVKLLLTSEQAEKLRELINGSDDEELKAIASEL